MVRVSCLLLTARDTLCVGWRLCAPQPYLQLIDIGEDGLSSNFTQKLPALPVFRPAGGQYADERDFGRPCSERIVYVVAYVKADVWVPASQYFQKTLGIWFGLFDVFHGNDFLEELPSAAAVERVIEFSACAACEERELGSFG